MKTHLKLRNIRNVIHNFTEYDLPLINAICRQILTVLRRRANGKNSFRKGKQTGDAFFTVEPATFLWFLTDPRCMGPVHLLESCI